MNVLIVSGEISGDYYGSLLAAQLKRLHPDLTLFAIGGNKLREIADVFVADIASANAIGVWERVSQILFYSTFFKQFETFLSGQKMDYAILIDFQHYNFRVAKLLQKAGVPIVTFITPNFWIWSDRKHAKALAAYSEKIITIYPPEYTLYNELAPGKVEYFGHPLAELIQPLTSTEPRSGNTLVLFPGSRKQEIELLLPKMLEIARQFGNQIPGAIIYLPISSEKFAENIYQAVEKYPVPGLEIWTGDKKALFERADVILSVTGTTTLEAVLYGIPVVMVGALAHLTYFLVRYVLRLPLKYVSLPNILAGREVIPEFQQYDVKVAPVLKSLVELSRPEARLTIQNSLKEIRQLIGSNKSVFEQVARSILAHVK